MIRSLALTVLFLLGIASAATADTLVLKDGKTVRGTVVGTDEAKVTLELADAPGSRFGVGFDQLTDFSLYDLKLRTLAADTADAHVALADFCEGRQMFHFAVVELKKAGELDPARAAAFAERIAALQDTCGRVFYDKGQSLLGAGRFQEAIRFFKDVTTRYSGCKFDQKAKDGIQQAQAALADDKKRIAAEKARASDEAEAAEKATAGAAARQRIFGLLKKGKELNQAANAAAKSLSKQEDLFEQAQAVLEKARKLALSLPDAPAGGGAGETTLVAKPQVVEEVTDHLIEAFVGLGFNALQRGAFEKAFEYAGLALALEPNNESAVGLRSSIATARAAAGR